MPSAYLLDEHKSLWPWEVEPYRLWSLLDMLKPWGHHFGEFFACLLDRQQAMAQLDPAQKLAPNDQAYITHLLGRGRECCKELGLDSGGQIDRLYALLDTSLQKSMPTFPVPTAGDVAVRLRIIRESIDRELRSRLFLFVPTAQAERYDQPELFGSDVGAKFAKASADIREAGTCVALGRPTAAVFHLMCVLDVGLDSLAFAVGVPYSRKNWEQIFQEIEKKVPTVPAPQDREYYGRAVLEFKFFRDCWRNHTMHGRGRYTEQEALGVFGHVKAFMVHLAARLQERP